MRQVRQLLGVTFVMAQFSSGCSPTSGLNWKVVGSLTDGPETYFVEVDQTALMRRAVYDDAVKALCRGDGLCRIMFFAPGDRAPTSQRAADFFNSGGFTGFSNLAVWVSNKGNGEFTGWDCKRAGIEGAPLGALCGDGTAEAHKAILALAGRAGMQKNCRWPANNDLAIVTKYIREIRDIARQRQFQNSFELMYANGNGRPDDLSQCENVRIRTEPDVLAARKLLSGK